MVADTTTPAGSGQPALSTAAGTVPDLNSLRGWAGELGFSQVGIADAGSFDGSAQLQAWLDKKFHGELTYMARDADKRARPSQLLPGTVSAVMVGMDYAPQAATTASDGWVNLAWQQIRNDGAAYVSTYARGRDYHKVVRSRLQKLADRIAQQAGPFGYRAFCDSAPVMEVALAQRAGVGWRGKHTLLLNRTHGSMFFLGTLYTDLPLPATAPVSAHCGSCQRCIDVCPTQAIVAPYQLDARRCISYLTIELHGAIPVELRPLIGNRIYGCDDCQLVCPWNKYAQSGAGSDFMARHGLDTAQLLGLFAWTQEQFDARTLGSPIRRIGYQRWLRNIAVALGNVDASRCEHGKLAAVRQALIERRGVVSDLVAEHIDWALQQLAS